VEKRSKQNVLKKKIKTPVEDKPKEKVPEKVLVQQSQVIVIQKEDYTKLPKQIDGKFEVFDEDNCLRPTIINPDIVFEKKAHKGLISEPTMETLDADLQQKEKNKAFDLIDGLSRSGSLSFDHANLHILIAATHCFDQTLMDTIVKSNVNPIEKIERSSLIISSCIQKQEFQNLVADDQLVRVKTFSSILFTK